MKYQSTRNSNIKINSADAIKQGISVEGGLFVPETIPNVTMEEIFGFVNMSYEERARIILSKFLTDYTSDELEDCCKKAYCFEKFPVEGTAPVKKLNETTYMLELWHGPTCAFKDMALQILPHLLTKALKKTGEDKEIVILVATSGDTGKAALEGFKDVEGTRIQVFYPVDGVSEIQKLQMVTQEGSNVRVSAVRGNFDDAQTGVKNIFTNEEFKNKINSSGFDFSSANSINWGRLVPQIVYYFSSYADMLKSGDIVCGEKINICVPTGNFGNILAGYFAKLMGLPVNKFICASNKNNILTDFITTGVYDKNRDFYTTSSPSMDIIISSNLERLLYIISNYDDKLVKECMNNLNSDGKYSVPGNIFDKISLEFAAGCCDDNMTSVTIGDTFAKYGYVADTHTAVALKVYEDYKNKTGDTTKTVIASTANPFKFNESVLSALKPDEDFEKYNEFELLELLAKEGNIAIPNSLSSLKHKKIRFDSVYEKTEMLSAVEEFLL